MKIVIASDSFKGSATSLEIATYLESGIRRVIKEEDCEIVKVPIADGGEGTLETIQLIHNIKTINVSVLDPLQRVIQAQIGQLEEDTFIIEMAQASGITLLEDHELDPYKSTSYGTGQLIKHCLDLGAKKIIIGIGGSATNDGGMGLAQALGIKFFDENNIELPISGSSILEVHRFDYTDIDKRLKEVSITILSDVTNPLCGLNGASQVFGPQKGLSKIDIERFDKALYSFGKLINEELMNKEGAGAAGGVGFILQALFNGQLTSGVDEILKLIEFEKIIENADLIITGEGHLDSQSLGGKAITGILKYAQHAHVPVIVIAGSIPNDLSKFYDVGFDLILSIINGIQSLQEAMTQVQSLVENCGESIIRAYQLKERGKR